MYLTYIYIYIINIYIYCIYSIYILHIIYLYIYICIYTTHTLYVTYSISSNNRLGCWENTPSPATGGGNHLAGGEGGCGGPCSYISIYSIYYRMYFHIELFFFSTHLRFVGGFVPPFRNKDGFFVPGVAPIPLQGRSSSDQKLLPAAEGGWAGTQGAWNQDMAMEHIFNWETISLGNYHLFFSLGMIFWFLALQTIAFLPFCFSASSPLFGFSEIFFSGSLLFCFSEMCFSAFLLFRFFFISLLFCFTSFCLLFFFFSAFWRLLCFSPFCFLLLYLFFLHSLFLVFLLSSPFFCFLTSTTTTTRTTRTTRQEQQEEQEQQEQQEQQEEQEQQEQQE